MGHPITRRRFLYGTALAVAPRIAAAQPVPRTPRIGYMSFGPVARGTLAGSHEGFLQGLGELGYAPGRNLVIEYRHAAGPAGTGSAP